MWTDAWPDDHYSAVIVREYEGKNAVADFQGDAEQLLEQGYEPVGQHYVEGAWGSAMTLFCVFTIPLGIGVLLLASLLLGERPAGRLRVTYLQRKSGSR